MLFQTTICRMKVVVIETFKGTLSREKFVKLGLKQGLPCTKNLCYLYLNVSKMNLQGTEHSVFT
jgi:hypothetical protein